MGSHPRDRSSPDRNAASQDRQAPQKPLQILSQLASGLPTLDTAQCSNGTPAPPSSTTPATLAQMIQQYVFRTTGRNVAAPACRGQGTIDGYGTQFPHLQADPPPSVG